MFRESGARANLRQQCTSGSCRIGLCYGCFLALYSMFAFHSVQLLFAASLCVFGLPLFCLTVSDFLALSFVLRDLGSGFLRVGRSWIVVEVLVFSGFTDLSVLA